MVAEVRIKRSHLGRSEHALVNECLVGKARDIAEFAAWHVLQGLLDDAAHDVKFLLESPRALHVIAALDKHLPHEGLVTLGRGAEVVVIGRHASPAEDAESFGFDQLFELPFARVTLVTIHRQIDHADPVMAFVRKLDVESFCMMAEKFVRHLHQDARAVAGIVLTSACAAMVEIHEHLEGIVDELMSLFRTEMDDKSDPTRVVFVRGIVETLFFREAWSIHDSLISNEIIRYSVRQCLSS